MSSLFPALVLFIVIGSILKAPAIPINDPALYAFYGLRLTHGAHLYTNLPEVKFPSIYYLNALFQLAFGPNYVVHTCAKAAIALGTIALFAALIRAFGIAAWREASLLFAVCYCLLFPQYGYPEQYAMPFILGAFWLALKERAVWAGCALAVGTTFWVQSPIMFIPLLVRPIRVRHRLFLVAGFVLTFVVFAAAFVPVLGFGWIMLPISTWHGFAFQNAHGIFLGSEPTELRAAIFQTALGTLIGLFLLVIRRPQTESQRFSLWWSTAALIGGLIPPRLFEWYFLPLFPALSMVVAAFGFEATIRRRAILAITVLAFGINTCRNAWGVASFFQRYAQNVLVVGDGIRQTLGAGAILWTDQYIPEVYLAAQAVEPQPGANAPFTAGFVASGTSTATLLGDFPPSRVPQLLIHGPYRSAPLFGSVTMVDVQHHFSRMYVPVCGGRVGGIDIYALPAIDARFRCAG